MNCRECHDGVMMEARVDVWLERAGRWVLVRGIDALVCDACGERVFTEDAATMLADITADDSRIIPTDFVYAQVFDVPVIRTREADGRQPLGVQSTTTPAQEPVRLFAEPQFTGSTQQLDVAV